MKYLSEMPTDDQISEFAQKLLDTEAFAVLLSVRLEQLNDDILLTDDDKEALKAKAEHTSLRYLVQWVEERANRRKKQNGRR